MSEINKRTLDVCLSVINGNLRKLAKQKQEVRKELGLLEVHPRAGQMARTLLVIVQE